MDKDDKSLREKFKKEIMTSDWELLKPHHLRNALFIVDPKLDLMQISIDVALDNVDSIKVAMESNLLRRPSQDELTLWEKNPNNKVGSFLIVSPYVFLKIED